jgi:hypothetical protein
MCGCPVIAVLSLLSYPAPFRAITWLFCCGFLLHLLAVLSDVPILAVCPGLSSSLWGCQPWLPWALPRKLLSCHGCLSGLSCHLLSRLSCHGFPVTAILPRLSCYCYPTTDFLLLLSCYGYSVKAVLPRLPCHGCLLMAM